VEFEGSLTELLIDMKTTATGAVTLLVLYGRNIMSTVSPPVQPICGRLFVTLHLHDARFSHQIPSGENKRTTLIALLVFCIEEPNTSHRENKSFQIGACTARIPVAVNVSGHSIEVGQRKLIKWISDHRPNANGNPCDGPLRIIHDFSADFRSASKLDGQF